MAESKNPFAMLEDQVKCSVCLEIYKNPKALSCQHAFCSDCINLLPVATSMVQCPTCRTPTHLPKEGTKGLQSAFHVNNLLEVYKLASMHKVTHLPVPPHTQQPPTVQGNFSIRCSLHNMLLDVYCEQCDAVICTKCSFKGHRNHNCDLVSDVVLKQQEIIKNSLLSVKNTAETINKALVSLRFQQKQIRERGESVKLEISSSIQQLVDVLQHSGKQLKVAVDTKVQEKMRRISCQIEHGEKLLSELNKCEDQVEKKIQEDLNLTLMFSRRNELLEKIKKASEVDIGGLQFQEKVDIAFALQLGKMDQCSNVGEILCISEDVPSIESEPASKVSNGPVPVAFVGRHFKCHITIEASPLVSHSNNIFCHLLPSDGGPVITCDEEVNPEGIHTVSFTPSSPGYHSFKFKVDEMEIKTKPKEVKVQHTLYSRFSLARTISGVINPWAISVIQNDLLVVSEYQRGSISVITKLGHRVTSFSSYGTGQGELKGPSGLAVTLEGDVLVTEFINHRVQKFSVNGSLLACVGVRGSGELQFNCPSDIVVGPRGHVYITDTSNHRIQVLNTDLTFSHVIGGRGSGPGQLSVPRGISVDAQGDIYVCDTGNSRIQKLSPSGEYLAHFGEGILKDPWYLALDHIGLIYVKDNNMHSIFTFNMDGEMVDSVAAGEDNQGLLAALHGITVDDSGTIFACHSSKSIISVF